MIIYNFRLSNKLSQEEMNVTTSIKFFILAFSSFMFTYQTLVAMHKLTSPPVVDSTERFNIKDIDNILITICPLTNGIHQN